MECNRKTGVLAALVLVLAVVPSSTVWAAEGEALQVARYSTMVPVPTAAQVDPLDAVITIAFPEQLTSVAEALHHVLERSGYRLASSQAADPATSVFAELPLPEVHRRLGPITVAGALDTLAGPAWSLVVDPVHRLVSFELAQEFAAIGLPQREHLRALPSTAANKASECDAHQVPTWCQPL